MSSRASARATLAGAVLVVAVAILAYLPALNLGWTLDDATLLSDPSLDDPAAWSDLLGRGLFSGVRSYGGYYRPLTTLSFAVEARLGLGAPAARHATNLLLHAAVAMGAFLLLRRLLAREPAGGGMALLAALLFAVHPVHVDAVDPVTGRGDLLAAGWMLLAWGAFHAGRESGFAGGRGSGRWLRLGAAASFAAALLSKESAAVLPLLLLAGAWTASEPAARRRAILARPVEYVPLLVVLLGYAWLRLEVLGGWVEPGLPDPLDNPLAGEGFVARALGAPVAWLESARLLVWPWPLSPDYSGGALAVPAGAADLRTLAGWALAAVLVVGLVLAARRSAPAFLAIAVLLVPLLPVANLGFVAPVLLAERLLYLPVLGFTLLLAVAGAAALRWAPARSRVAIGAVVATMLCGIYGFATLAHHRVYQDDLTLWHHVTRVTPRNAKAWYNLGNARIRGGTDAEAAEAFEAAVRVAPELAVAWSNLGVARSRSGDEDAAIEAFRRALALEPALAQAHAGLGSLLLRRGGVEAGRHHLRTSLALEPEQPDAPLIREVLGRLEPATGP